MIPPIEPPGGADEGDFRRFAELVKRELHAEDVRLLDPDAKTVEASNAMFARLPDRRTLAVTFGAEPPDAPALQRRLHILADTFAQALEREGEGEKRAHRTSVPRSLHEELRALARRARALDAVVLDAHSPVVWGSSNATQPIVDPAMTSDAVSEVEGALRLLEQSRHDLLTLVGDDDDAADNDADAADADADADAEADADADANYAANPTHVDADADADADASVPSSEADPALPELSARAIRNVRALPQIPALRRGQPMHHTVREDDFGYVAQAFAAIYLLVLVYDAPFDELRAERAIADALPRIERLVIALPPLDPTPEPRSNVISLRSRARR